VLGECPNGVTGVKGVRTHTGLICGTAGPTASMLIETSQALQNVRAKVEKADSGSGTFIVVMKAL